METSLKGSGVFISTRHFLTVAQSLSHGFKADGQPNYLPKEILRIRTQLHDHKVLKYERHPHRDKLHSRNNIAVILVSSYI